MDWFAGIGSQETPDQVQVRLSSISASLCEAGWGLRSGHAKGADKACEKGCDLVGGRKQIFLPFKGFNGSTSTLYGPYGEAHADLVREFHPKPSALSFWDKKRGFQNDFGWKAMLRNGSQLLGPDLDDWSKAVLCWTEGGRVKGGTGQALRIAMHPRYNIPIHNLGHPAYANQTDTVIIDRILSGWQPEPPAEQLSFL